MEIGGLPGLMAVPRATACRTDQSRRVSGRTNRQRSIRCATTLCQHYEHVKLDSLRDLDRPKKQCAVPNLDSSTRMACPMFCSSKRTGTVVSISLLVLANPFGRQTMLAKSQCHVLTGSTGAPKSPVPIARQLKHRTARQRPFAKQRQRVPYHIKMARCDPSCGSPDWLAPNCCKHCVCWLARCGDCKL